MTHFDIYVLVFVLLSLYDIFAFENKLPSCSSIQTMVSMIDTKGGNILLLAALAIYFFYRTEQM